MHMKRLVAMLLVLLMMPLAMAEETAKYRVEEMPVEKDDGNVVAGWLYVPEGDGPFPTLVLCHGFNGTHQNMTGYAEYFAQRGYLCYVFDFCGGGVDSQSTGATEDMTLLTELDDLDNVVSLVSCLDEADPERFVIAGASQGGLLTALYTARNPELVRAAILLYPALMAPDNARTNYPEASDIPETVTFMHMTVGRGYYEVMREINAWAEIAAFDKPVLLLHGTADQIVPHSVSEQALTVYPNAQLVSIPDAGHGFYLADRQTACETMEAFLADVMQASAE